MTHTLKAHSETTADAPTSQTRIRTPRQALEDLRRDLDAGALAGVEQYARALQRWNQDAPALVILELRERELRELIERPQPVTGLDVELLLSAALAWQAEGLTSYARELREFARILSDAIAGDRPLRYTVEDLHAVYYAMRAARCLDLDVRCALWELGQRLQRAAGLVTMAPRFQVTERGAQALYEAEQLERVRCEPEATRRYGRLLASLAREEESHAVGLVHRPDTAPGGGSRAEPSNDGLSSGADAAHRAPAPLEYIVRVQVPGGSLWLSYQGADSGWYWIGVESLAYRFDRRDQAERVGRCEFVPRWLDEDPDAGPHVEPVAPLQEDAV